MKNSDLINIIKRLITLGDNLKIEYYENSKIIKNYEIEIYDYDAMNNRLMYIENYNKNVYYELYKLINRINFKISSKSIHWLSILKVVLSKYENIYQTRELEMALFFGALKGQKTNEK